MAKRMRKVRTFAHTATKTQEKFIISQAKKLYDDPLLILPEATSDDAEKYLRKPQKQLEKVSKHRENTKKLEKLAQKKSIEGAVAATLLVAHGEKAPYLGVVKLPTGDVVYAQRGTPKREHLVAIQHFDDPILRLLAFAEYSQKKSLFFYSWNDQFVCTGSDSTPPEEFLSFVKNTLSFTQKDNIWMNTSLDVEQIKQSQPLKHWYIRIHWKSADRIIVIDESSAKNTKNTIISISKYMLHPQLKEDMDIHVIGSLVENLDDIQTTEFIDEYLSGGLTDLDFIKKNKQHQTKTLQESDEPLYILDGTSYGNNAEAFIDALNPTLMEKQALTILLQTMKEPLIISKITPNKLLENHWKEYGEAIVQELIDDTSMASSFANLDDTPSEILKLIKDYQKRQKILTQLPQYTKLPPLTDYVDSVARTYKTFGLKKTISAIKDHPDTTKGKTLSYAFLLALDKGKDTKWKYTDVEIEYATFLQEYAKKLLEATPKEYSTRLQELIISSGSSEKIPE